ncbi:MAG: transcription termination/antitermination protein NusG [Anaerolineales bacterium]|jgi:transcription antitermination factor NusG
MADQWYAIRSKPRKEDIVWQQLRSRELEVFYPRVRVHPVNPRSKKVKPYFPGYMFVKADLDELGMSTFQWMPHTLGLVSFGGEPAYVPEELLTAIRKRIEEINAAGGELFDDLKQGDAVLIQAGPFKGYEAIFDTRLPGTERVRVLLKFLSDRKVRIELDASNIKQNKKK